MNIQLKKLSFLCLLIFLFACKGREENNREKQFTSVKVVKIQDQEIVNTDRYVGVVEAELQSSISFRVSGHIEQLLVNEGEKVQKGQLLGFVDKTSFVDAYEAAKATLVQAQDAYDRLKQLYDNNSLSEIDWVKAQTSLKQSQSAERIALNNLKHTRLVAPFTGIIGDLRAEIGENVLPGSPVCSLLDISNVKIKIAIPEKYIGKINNQDVLITIPALNNLEVKGKISEKNMVADPISHTYNVKIKLNNLEKKLLPGMVCNVKLILNSEPKIVVPNKAIHIINNTHFVWCVKDSCAISVPVEIGELTPDGVIIKKGLHKGDQVIVSGYQKVSEQMKVQVL